VIAASSSGVKVVEVKTFTHGGARNLGIRHATGEVVVLMTQDAVPADEHWLSRLIAPLRDPEVAGVYSRQVPRPDASPMEQFFLADRFPAGDQVVRRHQGTRPPVYPETFFSNVSSAARRETWTRFPFDESLLMSEDQQFTRDVLLAGMAIVYEPHSVVIHSHTYTLMQTFRRYFDSVVAFRQLSESHGAGKSARLGGSKLAAEVRYIAKQHPASLPYFVVYMAFKSAGVLAGHLAPYLPRAWCAKMSLHSGWWRLARLDKQGRNREDARPHD